MDRVLILGLALAAIAAISAQSQSFDIIIRKGTVIDGSGNPRFDADGGGPLDLAQQLNTLAVSGLAVNIGGYSGFNSAWTTVVGNADRRPSADEIQRMRGMIASGLSQGAWGVSAGLDCKPGYFARAEEVIKIVDVARPARTNFTNHDRITPESNFSSKVGIAETLAIGQKGGLVPVVTHMKVQGREQGSAGEVLTSMAQSTRRGYYTAADAYPYLAGQSGLGALIIPGWAQEGGREAMLQRFADPKLRAQIIAESEQAMPARFGGPQGVYLTRTQQELTAVMKETNAAAGETVLRILEQADPGAILRFGIEEDLVKILTDPVTSMACDCGASTATRPHPRFYGSYPRVLGRYVREQQIMTWEQAIRKSTWLPAATIGMIDRGLVAPGMAADVTVFDPNTVIDRATYENPAQRSQGIRFVLVNGTVALEDGVPTQAHSGKLLFRTVNMPSRPTTEALRSLSAKGTVSGHRMSINLTHRAGARQALGTFDIEGFAPVETIGVLQTTTNGWASVTGVDRMQRAVTLIVDRHDPANPGSATFAVNLDGAPAVRGSVPLAAVSINTR